MADNKYKIISHDTARSFGLYDARDDYMLSSVSVFDYPEDVKGTPLGWLLEIDYASGRRRVDCPEHRSMWSNTGLVSRATKHITPDGRVDAMPVNKNVVLVLEVDGADKLDALGMKVSNSHLPSPLVSALNDYVMGKISGRMYGHSRVGVVDGQPCLLYSKTRRDAFAGRLVNERLRAVIPKLRCTMLINGSNVELYGNHSSKVVEEVIDLILPTTSLEFAVTAEEIEAVYATGPQSCMSGPVGPTGRMHAAGYPSPSVHPTYLYAGGDLAIAWLSTGKGKVLARTLCSPRTKKYIGTKLYGGAHATMLMAELRTMGYTSGLLSDNDKGEMYQLAPPVLSEYARTAITCQWNHEIYNDIIRPYLDSGYVVADPKTGKLYATAAATPRPSGFLSSFMLDPEDQTVFHPASGCIVAKFPAVHKHKHMKVMVPAKDPRAVYLSGDYPVFIPESMRSSCVLALTRGGDIVSVPEAALGDGPYVRVDRASRGVDYVHGDWIPDGINYGTGLYTGPLTLDFTSASVVVNDDTFKVVSDGAYWSYNGGQHDASAL